MGLEAAEVSVDGDGDFSSYMVARWPGLIRSLVLLGCRRTPRRSASPVTDSLAAATVGAGPRDRRHRRARLPHRAGAAGAAAQARAPPDQHAGPTPSRRCSLDPTQADPAQRLALRRALEDALAQMPVEERTVLVLRFVAELTQVQVADVLDDRSRRGAADGRPTGWRGWTWRRCGRSGERAPRGRGLPRGRGGGPGRSAAGRRRSLALAATVGAGG